MRPSRELSFLRSYDGGLLPYRELDHALGLTEPGGEVLLETGHGEEQPTSSVGASSAIGVRSAGRIRDTNDAEPLSPSSTSSLQPVMRAVMDRNGLDWMAASTSQMGRFETEWLATDPNLAALSDLSGVWVEDNAVSATPATVTSIKLLTRR